MKNFDAKKETERVIDFVRTYYKENNLGGAILGISGGKDSGVVAAILTEALGKESEASYGTAKILPCDRSRH